MRLNDIRFGHNIYRQFRAHWLRQRKVQVPSTPAESILLARGINVVEPKDVLRPALDEEPYTPPPSPTKNVITEKPQCYFFKNTFMPIAGIEQCQLITNSIAFNSLPKTVLNQVIESSEEDELLVKKFAQSAHLLDAQQSSLPHVLDVVNLPGYKPPRSFGIRKSKKISTLIHKFLLHLNQIQDSNSEYRSFLEDVMSGVTLTHSGSLMHLNHEAKILVCARTPMKPVASTAEVKELSTTPLPDIFPFSPFIHSKSLTNYEIQDGFAVPGGILCPHTIVVSCDHHLFRGSEESISGMSLLHGFSHSAAYVKEKYQVEQCDLGNLETPVTVNVVLTTGQNIQMSQFQLNTLDLSPSNPVKNLFWYSSWQPIFSKINFTEARPMIEEINATPYALLRSMFL